MHGSELSCAVVGLILLLADILMQRFCSYRAHQPPPSQVQQHAGNATAMCISRLPASTGSRIYA